MSINYGVKHETDVDLVVPLPGRDFELSRMYVSQPGGTQPPLPANAFGHGWQLNVTYSLEGVTNYDPPAALRITSHATGTALFTQVGTSHVWRSVGPSLQYIVEDELEVNIGEGTGLVYPVFALVEPGQWTAYFGRPSHASGLVSIDVNNWRDGILLQIDDSYGNSKVFSYSDIYDDNLENAGAVRLKTITCNRNTSSGPDAVARIQFDYYLYTYGTAEFRGALQGARVQRNTGSAWVDVQKVEYTYQAANGNQYVGTTRDLVQVTKSTLVDPYVFPDTNNTNQWHATITQYRYHNETINESGTTDSDSDGFVESGDEHQLKAVISPQQIEFAAEQYNTNPPDGYKTLAAYATYLMDLDDGEYAYGSVKVMALASKVLAKYNNATGGNREVFEQYLQSSCGCSGGASQGIRLIYSFMPFDSAADGQYSRTMRIAESYRDPEIEEEEDGWVERRVHYYDMVRYTTGTSQMYYVVNDVVEEHLGPSNYRYWVTHYDYESFTKNGSTERRVKRIYSPQAMGGVTYTPAYTTESPPSLSPSNWTSSSGLVYEFNYDSNSRITETFVRDGYDSGNPSANKYTVTKNTWGHDDLQNYPNERSYLLTKTENHRTISASTDNDKEATEFAYTFHSGTDGIQWIETAVEAELTAENGPGGKYYAHEYFNISGQNTWSRRMDDSLVKRTFHNDTGALLQSDENSSDSGSPTPPSAFDGHGSFDGRDDDGGTLTSVYAYDILGRLRSIETPTHKITRYVRQLANTSKLAPAERQHFVVSGNPANYSNIPYLALTVLPHNFSGGFDGPAYVTVMDAAGSQIQVSTFSLVSDTNSPYSEIEPDPYDFDLNTELSRSTVQHHFTGAVQSTTDYHSIAGWGENSGKYQTSYAYDSMGRVKSITEPTGTLRTYEYDNHDRLVRIKTGTTSANSATVAEYFYDGGGSAAQGMGNGNLTWVKEFTGEDSGGEVRNSKFTYDFRSRLVKVENPLPPHVWIEYDNLNRPIMAGLFKSVPSGIASPLADRGAYIEIKYSQRGAVYERKLKAEPDNTSNDHFLSTFIWYDQIGRPIEAWGPNAPATKTSYDANGRVKTIYTTDRHGNPEAQALQDVAPGASGNWADAASVVDDVILEQTTFSYNEHGLNDLTTHRMRTHDADDDDSLRGDLEALESSEPESVITTYTRAFFDAADRIIWTADYGTNNSNGFEYGGDAPSDDTPSWQAEGDEILTEIAYNNRGLVETITQNIGTTSAEIYQVTKMLYDDLGRTRAAIENYKDAALDTSGGSPWDSTNEIWNFTGINSNNPDEDRVTSTVYLIADNPNTSVTTDHQIKQIAHTSNTGGQVTRYVLAAAPASPESEGSLQTSYDLLLSIIYPGSGSESIRTVSVAYNRLGEVRYTKDQNGTKHQVILDSLGRPKVDKVTAFGNSDIDQVIDAIRIAYDDFGRVDAVRSHDGYTSESSLGTIKNAVKFGYTGLWQINDIWQQHDGDVVTSTSLKTSYTYTRSPSTSKNYSRPDTLNYPSGYQLPHVYGEDDFNDLISRVTQLGVHDNGGVGYSYIGLGLVATVDFAGPRGSLDVLLDRQVKHDGTRDPGHYNSFDRFGRVIAHRWVDGNFTNGSSGYSNIPAIVEMTHSYAKADNLLTSLDGRQGAGRVNRDYQFVHDALSRLKEAKRGIKGTSSFTHVADPGGAYVPSQKWAMDFLGNWTSVITDKDGDGTDGVTPDVTETRTHSTANELTEIDPNISASDDELDLTHDNNGNITSRQLTRIGSDGYTRYRYTHDAWNRLVKVEHITKPNGGSEARRLLRRNMNTTA